MKTIANLSSTAGMIVLVCVIGHAAAQEKTEPKYSNIGLKLNLGLGSQDFPVEQDLEAGGAASLSLGYGVSQRVTLWLGAQSGSFKHEQREALHSDFVGLDLGLQYKLRPGERLRPYGKVGVGAYFLGTNYNGTGLDAFRPGEVLSGGGVAWALGAEYRLTRFFTLGAEFYWKDFDYTQKRVGDGEFVNMPEAVPGNTRGFMLNFILH